MYTAMMTALGQNDNQWPPAFVLDTLRRGVPEGMVGAQDIPGGPDARGPVYWWHAIGTLLFLHLGCATDKVQALCTV